MPYTRRIGGLKQPKRARLLYAQRAVYNVQAFYAGITGLVV